VFQNDQTPALHYSRRVICATTVSWHAGKDEKLKVLQMLKVLFEHDRKLHRDVRQLSYELRLHRCMGLETAHRICQLLLKGRYAHNCEDATFD
jgi:hypothetical protein